MSGVLRVRHPAVVFHRPPRARNLRVTLAEAVSTARVPEAPRDAFRAIGDLRRWENRGLASGGAGTAFSDDIPRLSDRGLSQRLFVRDGAAWTVVRTEPADVEGWRPVTARELAAYLTGGDIAPVAEAGMRRAFARSPISFRGATRADVAASGAALREGDVVRDGRAHAEADLQAWIDRNIVEVDGGVRVRCQGPLAIPIGIRHGSRVLETMPYGCDVPVALAVAPSEALLPWGRSTLQGSQLRAGLTVEALGGLVDRDAALAHFANAAPDEVLGCLRRLAARSSGIPDWAAGPEPAVAALRSLAAEAMTGRLGPGHAEVVARLVREIVPRPPAPGFRGFLSVAESMHLADIAHFASGPVAALARQLPEADLADVGGLAP